MNNNDCKNSDGFNNFVYLAEKISNALKNINNKFCGIVKFDIVFLGIKEQKILDYSLGTTCGYQSLNEMGFSKIIKTTEKEGFYFGFSGLEL